LLSSKKLLLSRLIHYCSPFTRIGPEVTDSNVIDDFCAIGEVPTPELKLMGKLTARIAGKWMY